ncbi:restriction endonuclease subunit S [Streptomyces sp. NPDC060311]|uniref:restriction endonuclease subunit S n=1 Tax=Streptomyces sp. NPDC060311 TaxID=3347096 RepID=UPI00364B479B
MSRTVSLRWALNLRSGTSCEERVDEGGFPLMGASGMIGRAARCNTMAGSAIIGRVGTVGAVSLAHTNCWASDNTIVATAGPTLYPTYMYYLLVGARLSELASKTAQPLLTAGAIGAQRFPVPSLAEQHRAAAFLDDRTSSLDALMGKRKAQLELLRLKRFSAVRDLLLRGHHGAKTKKTGLAWLPEIPADWDLVPLRYLTVCLDGKRVPLSSSERSDRQGPYPYYGASRVVDHVDDYLFDEPLVLLGEDGAQLGNPNLEVSFYVEGKAWVNNHAHVLRPAGINGRFLTEVLNVFDRNLYMSGATREKITQDEMNRILVPVPPASQQEELVHRILAARSQHVKLENALRSQMHLLGERRQALITAVVTGQFDVSTADGRNVTEGVSA